LQGAREHHAGWAAVAAAVAERPVEQRQYLPGGLRVLRNCCTSPKSRPILIFWWRRPAA
jgi:hypothetical protein